MDEGFLAVGHIGTVYIRFYYVYITCLCYCVRVCEQNIWSGVSVWEEPSPWQPQALSTLCDAALSLFLFLSLPMLSLLYTIVSREQGRGDVLVCASCVCLISVCLRTLCFMKKCHSGMSRLIDISFILSANRITFTVRWRICAVWDCWIVDVSHRLGPWLLKEEQSGVRKFRM